MSSSDNLRVLPGIAPRPAPIAPAQPSSQPQPPAQGHPAAPVTGPSSSANLATHDSAHTPESDDDGTPGKKKSGKARRRKVNHACLYCRRSHMTCDDGRPCQRCIKREIGHLCHDEHRSGREKQSSVDSVSIPPATNTTAPSVPQMNIMPSAVSYPPATVNPQLWTNPIGIGMADPTPLYPLESFGREFSSLSDFLETLDEHAFFNPPPALPPAFPQHPSAPPQPQPQPQPQPPPPPPPMAPPLTQSSSLSSQGAPQPDPSPSHPPPQTPDEPVLPVASMTEKFLLTAADQEPGPRDERLKRVIRTKYEAGLLKPYNYVKGYARLSRWMDKNVSQESKQQILHPLSVLRPKFRAIAQSLHDLDLVFIEEAFERLMLDYDRVFSVMGIPACLWRRTGEIYKGNREFAELVGLDGYMLRDGRLCIYELMAEESAVNYWEKYGNVAFDSSQKAVLTSCVLRYKPHLGAAESDLPGAVADGEEGLISCCFSFTIRRDTWGIPSMIVGNFIRL